MTSFAHDPDGYANPATRLKRYLASPYILLIFLWVGLYAWRPWYFGLYHDDWFLLRAPNWADVLPAFQQMPSRPLLVASNLLLSALLGSDPKAWQSLMAIGVLLVAHLLASVATRMAKILTPKGGNATCIGVASACFWIAMPWSLGYTAWPSTINGLFGLIFFLSLCRVLFSDRSAVKRAVLASMASVALGLTLEALWFAPILIAFFRLASDYLETPKIKRQDFLPLASLTAVQFLLIVYNRIWSVFAVGQNKALGTGAYEVFLSSVTSLLSMARAAISNHPALEIPIVLFVFICLSGFILANRKRKALFVLGLLICVAGFLFSVMLYAFGGYAVETSGLISRTTYGISLWLALLTAVMLSAAPTNGFIRSYMGLGGVAVLVMALIPIHLREARIWADAWNTEMTILSQFPAKEYAKVARPGDLLLVDGPQTGSTVYGFNAFWDISGALHSTFAEVRTVQPNPHDPLTDAWIATMMNTDKQRTIWSGDAVIQTWCASGGELWKLTVPSSVLLWRSGEATIQRIDRNTAFGCPPK